MLLEDQIATKTEERKSSQIDREYLVSWLFLIGSLMFLFDAILELTESISIHGVIHLSASILFTVGSILFIPTNKK